VRFASPATGWTLLTRTTGRDAGGCQPVIWLLRRAGEHPKEKPLGSGPTGDDAGAEQRAQVGADAVGLPVPPESVRQARPEDQKIVNHLPGGVRRLRAAV